MEIKVRAWDRQENKMSYGKFEQFDDMLGFRFEHFGIDTEVEYMLWTGLTDKNGKDIYAGDFVRSLHRRELNFEITFEKGCFMWGGEPLLFDDGEFLDDATWCEVSGNIHENPELRIWGKSGTVVMEE